LVVLFFIFGVALGPIGPGNKYARQSAWLQNAHTIGLCMFAYAQDHDQLYPDGNSSTEVFQKLLDGGYVTDPTLFYLAMPGKTKPVPGQKLKPENVSWDVTGGADLSSPDELPLVFMTGYKISYAPGSAAVPLVKPYPPFGLEEPYQKWFDWLLRRPTIRWSESGGIAVHYKNNSSMYKKLETAPNGDGTIPDFIPPDFKPDGKTYRQLTPDGVLP